MVICVEREIKSRKLVEYFVTFVDNKSRFV